MGYELINGKRYYRDSRGRLSLDRASQEAAQLRAQHDAGQPPAAAGTRTGGTGAALLPLKILAVVVLLVICAVVRNVRYDSPAEQAIDAYMDQHNGTAETVTEQVTQEAEETVSYEQE